VEIDMRQVREIQFDVEKGKGSKRSKRVRNQ